MGTKTAYRFDESSKEYLEPMPCYESPLEPGVFPLPANSTLIEPPVEKQGFAIIWTDTQWEYIQDNRNKPIYNIEDSRQRSTMSYKLADPVPAGYTLATPPDTQNWYKYDGTQWSLYTPPITVEDYDNALQSHLTAQRTARGYTTRQPDYYINSSVARWKQDAQDWVKHRDQVMLYGLQVQNDYAQGKTVPTLDQFKQALPKITWTLQI